jgi:mono/diheme cytochrome c family protein
MSLARPLLLVLAGLALTGCVRGCPSSRPPIHINPNMDDQPKYQPFEASRFFYDGKAMREPIPGTVARNDVRAQDAFHTGKDAGGAFVLTSPVEPDDALLARGADRYRIYCSPCHDVRGNGRGILYERGKVPTPSLHEERIRALPDGEMFDVVTLGKGLMPSYGYPIPPADRWAILAHVRRLQRERVASEAAFAATGTR